MNFSFILCLLALSLTSTSQSLRKQLLRLDKQLRDVQIIKCKDDSTLFIAIMVTEKDWWENLYLGRCQNGKLTDTIKIDSLPSSQSIYAAKQVTLEGIDKPLIEVFDVTHQGNGYYYLYEITGNKARLIALTRAVDWNFDGGYMYNNKYCSAIYKSGTLKPEYADINKDGFTDIILKGTIQVFDSDDKTILKQYPAKKVLLYNSKKGRFIEDLKLRKGFAIDEG